MRNITVTFDDGTQHVYQNAPDDLTPEQVTERAASEFGRGVKALDGGRNASAKPTAADARSMLKAGMAAGAATPEAQVVRKEDEIKRIARDRLAAFDRVNPERMIPGGGNVADFLDATRGSVANTFGIGPRVAGGIEALVTGKPYDEAFAINKETARQLRERSLTGDVAGMGIGGAGAAGVGARAVQGIASVAPKVGNFLQGLTTLTRGQTAKNAMRIVGGGAAAGGAQAAGEGTDVGEGATYGALGAGLVSGGVNALRGLARKVTRPFSSSAAKALREVVKESPDAIAARQADLSSRTGENVPVIAALDDGDFGRFSNRVLKEFEPANKIAKAKTGEQINGFMKRMEHHVKQAGATAQRSFDRTIRNPDRTPVALDQYGNPIQLPASGAIDDLVQLRDDTIDEMIAPIRNEMVDLSKLKVGEAERRLILQTGRSTAELADPIKRVMTGSGSANVTVKQLDGLRRKLNRNSEAAYNGDNPNLGDSYANAARSVRSFLEESYPAYKPAMDVYAAHSKMLKGFETANAGKRISDVSKPDLRRDLRTNEGRVGMMLGELHRQREVVGKSPSSAVNAAKDYGAEGKLTRQADPLDPTASQPGTITENMSPTSASELADSSRAEYEVLQRMTQAGGIDVAKAGEALDSPGTLAYGLALASGPSFVSTKVNFMRRLMQGLPTSIPPKVAENLTDMLFSGDPAKSQTAIRALQRVGITEQAMRSMGFPAAVGAGAARTPAGEEEQPIVEPSAPVDVAPQSDAGGEPDFEELANRVERQESGGNQDAVSPKGAIGVMQVMPKTAPDAARMAGVDFDEKKYRTDEAYNRKLGRAYLKEMLKQFGDEELALVAYNWGPGILRRTLDAGKDWRDVAPQETVDYVEKILG